MKRNLRLVPRAPDEASIQQPVRRPAKDCGCHGEGKAQRWCLVHQNEILDYARLHGPTKAEIKFNVSQHSIRAWRKKRRES